MQKCGLFQYAVIAALLFHFFFHLLPHTQLFQSILPVFWCVWAFVFLDAESPLGIQFLYFSFFILFLLFLIFRILKMNRE